ncbi:MAG: hypothetical protein ACOYMG_15390, partial [Candidatus Methylumidiphilus sp.]
MAAPSTRPNPLSQQAARLAGRRIPRDAAPKNRRFAHEGIGSGHQTPASGAFAGFRRAVRCRLTAKGHRPAGLPMSAIN